MKKTLKEFKEELKKIQPKLIVTGEYINSDTKIEIKDELNIKYLCTPFKLLQNRVPSILSAIDKNQAFKAKAEHVHGKKYNYELVKYTNSDVKIKIICQKHGVFEQRPSGHLNGKGCKKCRDVSNGLKKRIDKIDFINRCKFIHKEEYDYSKTNYINAKNKVEIICKKHGSFLQNPYNHLNKYGCPKCKNEKISNAAKKNSYGWSKTNWIKKHNTTINSNPKLYVIKCFDDNEEFIKIGITLRSLKIRYPGIYQMPYKYEILKEINDTIEKVFDLEQKIKKTFKKNKHIPKKIFSGMYECYDKTLEKKKIRLSSQELELK